MMPAKIAYHNLSLKIFDRVKFSKNLI